MLQLTSRTPPGRRAYLRSALLGDFLQHCDLAKFARWVLSLEEMEEMYDSARTFISETGKAVTSPKRAVPESRPQTTSVPA